MKKKDLVSEYKGLDARHPEYRLISGAVFGAWTIAALGAMVLLTTGRFWAGLVALGLAAGIVFGHSLWSIHLYEQDAEIERTRLLAATEEI